MMEFTLSGFGDEISPLLDEQMSVMGRLGIRFIELRGIDGRNISEYSVDEAPLLYERMKARGFGASALGTPLGKISIHDPFAPHLDLFCRMLDFAEAIHCENIRLFSFFIPEGESPASHKVEVFRRMEAFAKAAQGRKICLLHENEKHIYGDKPKRCLELMQAFDGAFGMTYDPSNFVQCDVDNKHAFAMLKGYIKYMHIKDSVYSEEKAGPDAGFSEVSDCHRTAGEGDGNILWILSELNKMSYRGFLSIEPHLLNNHSISGTGADKFMTAHEALHGLLDQL